MDKGNGNGKGKGKVGQRKTLGVRAGWGGVGGWRVGPLLRRF